MNQEALENLVRIHKLHREAADSNEVQGLVRSGNVRLKDAGLLSRWCDYLAWTSKHINEANTDLRFIIIPGYWAI